MKSAYFRKIVFICLIIMSACLVLYQGMRFDRHSLQDLMSNITISENKTSEQIKLYPTEEGFIAFIPAELKQNATIFFTLFDHFVINGKVVKSGDRFPELKDGIAYEIDLFFWGENPAGSSSITCYHADSIASVYIKTSDNSTATIDSDKSKKIKANFRVINLDGTESCSGKCSLKARGESSFFLEEQKSYNLNANKEIEPFGMDSAKKWALIANWDVDVSNLKNKIAFDLADQLNLEFTPDSTFCNLYIDGEYRGLYLLAERATNHSGSVKTDDMRAEHKRRGNSEQHAETREETLRDGTKIQYQVSTAAADDISGGYVLEESQRYAENNDNYFVTVQNP